jgi:hypothetical protein
VSDVHSRALRAPESDAKGTALEVINVIRSPLPAAFTPGPQTPYVAKRRHLATPHDYSSGGGIRTRDLRVMSPTSYQTAPPRNRAPSLSSVRGGVNPDRRALEPKGRLCFRGIHGLAPHRLYPGV